MIKINLLKFLKKKKKFVKNNTQPNPNLYWVIIFSLGLILMIISLIFSFYLFVKINKEEVLPPLDESEQLEKISKQRIDKILEIFIERKETSNRIQKLPSSVVDPSI